MLNFMPTPNRLIDGRAIPIEGQIFWSSDSLSRKGLLFPVNISTVRSASITPVKGKTVMAMLDTGCTVTSVDKKLAEELGLRVIGSSMARTATNMVEVMNYMADIVFPGNTLKPFNMLRVNSCNLGYDPKITDNSKNFAVLIGRDMMTRWHITWNGAVSMVYISD